MNRTAELSVMPGSQGTQRFLDLLAPGDAVTFQTFGEGHAKGARELNRILHGSLAEHAQTLTALNRRGAGVYWMVNAGDLKGRKAQNVQRIRALFVDLDGAPLEPVQAAPLAPHAIVETSPNRWHAYWRVSDCPLADFTPLQMALAARFDADKTVHDLPRVLRLPGFDHRKQGSFRSHLIALCDNPPYKLADFRAAFALDTVLALPAPKAASRTHWQFPERIRKGKRNETLFSLARRFAEKGIDAAGVNQRLHRINAKECDPPLCASEVDAIAANASRYGSDGFAILPHALLDSPQWKALAPAAHDIILTAFRRYNGSNNGNIALTWEGDFEALPGFGKKGKFYRHRKAAVSAGILAFASEGRNSQIGRKPDLFAIVPRWLRAVSPVSKREPCASIQKVHSYIDKQSYCAADFDCGREQVKTDEAA